MQEVVINTCYGGFGISQEAVEWLRENEYESGEQCVLPGEYYDDGSGPRESYFESFGRDVPRDDEGLIAVIRELGNDANGSHADLSIVEIPDGVEWTIKEYDGQEWVAETHRTWR